MVVVPESTLQQAAVHAAYPQLADLTFDALQMLTEQVGVDLATAIAFDRVKKDERFREFIERITADCSAPAIPRERSVNAQLAIVPNLGYGIDPKSQRLVAEIRQCADSLGLSSFMVATDPSRDLLSNARIVCDALDKAEADNLLLLSISKGSADVKMALAQSGAASAFSRVRGWINACGLLDGSPLTNLLLDSNFEGAERQFVAWYRKQDANIVRSIVAACRDCGRGPNRLLGRPLEIPSHVQLLNLVAFPMRAHLTYEHSRVFHALLTSLGPNDGFGLLADMIHKPGMMFPVWGADHYLNQVVNVPAIARALLAYLIENSVPKQERPIAESPKAISSTGSSEDCATGAEDHQRLRHGRQRTKGFAVGQYLQPAPMLFTRDGLNVFLGDMYRGRSAFLIGGGPSLTSHELELLGTRGILTCAMNNAAVVVRPNLWVSVDDPGNFADAIWRDPAITKFVPLCHMEKQIYIRDRDDQLVPAEELVGDMPAVFGFRRNETFVAEQWLREDCFNWGNQSQETDALGNKGSRSVMYIALRLLYYLGIRRVYLMGCDFRMSRGNKNYAFEQDRTPSSVRGNNSSYEILNSRLRALKPYFDEAGYEILNCTPDSGLTVFPPCDFHDAIHSAIADFPKVINTAGMYDRIRREKDAGGKSDVSLPCVTTKSSSISTSTAPQRIPELTLVIAIDHVSAAKLKHTWPTWMEFRPELREWPVIVVHDESVDPSDATVSFLGDHPKIAFRKWAMPDASTQREKMLTALVKVPAEAVETPWYLKLDVDVLATGPGTWLDPAWFQPNTDGRVPVYIASPWGYTKPANALKTLDDWGDQVPELASRPRLDIPFDTNGTLVRHPRITSWCFFGNTNWTREVAGYAPSSLPCPSQDTYLFYCAARRTDPALRVSMSHYGWEHCSTSVRRLAKRCADVLSPTLAAACPQT